MFIRVMRFIVLTMLSFMNFIFAGQSDTCHLDVSTTPTTQIGGLYLTASGTVNVLFVYVQFPDDNYWTNNSNWPKGQAPTYMASTVDAVWSSTPTAGSVTDYFNQMSFNNLKVTGTEVSVITPHTRVWYLNNGKQAGFIHKEVLQQLDVTMDFAQFDNWSYISENNHTNTPNDTVDMIFMMWRNVDSDTTVPVTTPPTQTVRKQLNLEPGGYASLDVSSITVDGGERYINGGYGGNCSGVTVIHPVGGDLNSNIIWRYARHEFGHYLLGGNNYHTDLGTWGILDGWGTPSECVNTFERERLGWINLDLTTINDVSTTQTYSGLTLPDFVTTGIAYRIKVPGGGADEYYLLENHQRISSFDVPDVNNPNAKGLFVIRQRYGVGNGTGIISAEGKYNWSVPYTLPDIYGGSGNLPVFQLGSSNRISGKSRRERIPWSSANHAIHYQLINGVVVKAGENGNPTVFTGTGKDQFDMSNNSVFSPASNPSSVGYTSNADSIAFEITGISNGVITLNIHVNNPEVASPAKPMDFAFSSTTPVTLSWTNNGESDRQYWEVWRKWYRSRFDQEDWMIRATPTTNSFQDMDFTNNPATNNTSVWYKIRTKDTQGKYSLFTDIISLTATQQYWKVGEIAQSNLPNNYSINQNYPNPFNPTTTITYALPEPSNVSITVFDRLGREVSTLVNQNRPAGFYMATFDASKLASGVYFYTIKAGSFNQSRKMLLLK
jgi:hypothetical protein